MKYLIIYCFLPLFAWQTCGVNQAATKQKTSTAEIMKDTINFTGSVQPIFVKNCSPCHFPGGKMYERMPFDKDTTIIHHEAGILKRIKDSDENLIIRSFILQQSNINNK